MNSGQGATSQRYKVPRFNTHAQCPHVHTWNVNPMTMLFSYKLYTATYFSFIFLMTQKVSGIVRFFQGFNISSGDW